MNTDPALKHTDPAFLHSDLTDMASGAFYRVYNTMGFGFLELVYQNALAIELRKAGVNFEREVLIEVWYDAEKVGHYRADFLLEGRVILEVKASLAIGEPDRKQLMNYLRGSHVEVGLLLHFGPKPVIRRILYTNDRKPHLALKHTETALKGH